MHVDFEVFEPWAALAGGVLIGLSASLLLLLNGRVAGVSGLLDGLVAPASPERVPRGIFLAGLVLAGALLLPFFPERFLIGIDRSLGAIVVAGLLVGYGTRLGGGCTSGHGVCGLSRGSVRSLTAVVTFMLTAGITVFVVEHLLGGRL